MMHNSRTAVKQHTRVSKNGREHTVKKHNRSVNFSELMPGKPTVKSTLAATGFATAVTGVAYLGSTITSVTAAMVWAVILVTLAALAYLFMPKGKRKAARRKVRDRVAEKTLRYLKLWKHHKMAKFDKGRPEMRRAKPKEAPARKSTKAAPKVRKNQNEGVTHDSHFYCVGEGKLCEPGRHYNYFAKDKGQGS